MRRTTLQQIQELDLAAGADPGQASTLFELLARAASERGEKVCVQIRRTSGWVRLSYRELLALAEAWGRELAAAGLSRGGRVMLVSDGMPEWVVGYFAVMAQAGTVVPVEPQLGLPDIQAFAARTGARIWLLSQDVHERLAEGLAKLEQPPAVFIVDRFAQRPQEARPPAPARDFDPATDGPAPSQQIASIPFTSGTTLAPKGVALTHANFLANIRSVRIVLQVTSADEFLAVLPIHHVLQFTAGVLLPLSVGATITFLEKLTPKVLMEGMQETGTTALLVVPRLLQLLVKTIQTRIDASPPTHRLIFKALLRVAGLNRALGKLCPPLAPGLRRLRAAMFGTVHQRLGGHLRLFLCGGAALPLNIYDLLDTMGFVVLEGYGLTETSPVLTANSPIHPRGGTVGPAVPGVELKIADPDAAGVGEVLARGESVFSGYLDDEEATRRVFSDGWFRTGDMGRLEPGGFLVLSGRADDMIVTGGGKNVYPDEIEWLYRGLPHVKDLSIIGMPDAASAGDAVHAVITLEEIDASGSMPSRDDREREIHEAIVNVSHRLPAYQRIRRVHFWEGELPQTSTRKIRRRQLQEALREKA
jgi:long-chain acyl-CoA synthetase